MTYKNVFVHVNGVNSSSVIETTVDLISLFSSKLIVCHMSIDARNSIPLLGEGMSVSMIESMIEVTNVELTKRRNVAYHEFKIIKKTLDEREHGGDDNPQVVWTEEVGHEEEIISRIGRLSDLLIFPKPDVHSEFSQTVALNTALFGTGKPVLVIERALPISAILENVVLSWNGSVESARAISMSIPLIKNARNVHVFVAGNSTKTKVSTIELLKYLKQHEIKCVTEQWVQSRKSVGSELLKHAKGIDASLIVMGAYTQNRFQKLILGGVTEYVLQNTKIPIFLVH